MTTLSNIGRYEIERELGRGGMAIVYLARDTAIKRQVAVKVLPRQFTFDPQFRARFQREAEIIAALEHSFIVPLYDFGEHDEQPFLVMQLMTGGSLADRLNGGPVSLPETAAIIRRMGMALDQAHAQGIVHRDLKPGNILFDQYNEAYLSDFGVARLIQSRHTLTGTGGVVGTPAYMSPEQAMGEGDVNYRSDIYSLGIITYELLAGHVPYWADTPLKLMVKHVTEPIPSILAVRPDLPGGWAELIERALAKNPIDRFASAGELAAALAVMVEIGQTTTRQDVKAQLWSEAETEERRQEEATLLGATVASPIKSKLAAPAVGPVRSGKKNLKPWLGGSMLLMVAGVILSAIFLANQIAPPPPATFAPETIVLVAAASTPTATVTPTHSPVPALTPTITQPPSPTQTPSPTPLPKPALTFTPTTTPNPPTATPTPIPTVTPVEVVSNNNLLGNCGGGRIAFSSDRDGNSEIYVMAPDGSNVIRLTDNPAYDSSPVWSPDGSRIAFDTDRDGNREIYVMNADGSEQINLTNFPGLDAEPVWSPDGSRIAFNRIAEDTNGDGDFSYEDDRVDVYVINVDGSEPINLTSQPGYDSYPAWSPDSRRIVFSRVVEDTNGDGQLNYDDNADIYMANADGSGQTNLTNNPADDSSAYWSPDGAQIGFRSGQDGVSKAYVMNVDGSGVTPLNSWVLNSWKPQEISPNGTCLVFATGQLAFQSEIAQSNVDGSDWINLTNNPARDSSPAWSSR